MVGVAIRMVNLTCLLLFQSGVGKAVLCLCTVLVAVLATVLSRCFRSSLTRNVLIRGKRSAEQRGWCERSRAEFYPNPFSPAN